jgi:hypothetical protein
MALPFSNIGLYSTSGLTEGHANVFDVNWGRNSLWTSYGGYLACYPRCLSLVGLIGISLVTHRGFTKAKKDGRIDIAVGGIRLRRLTERKRAGYERLV